MCLVAALACFLLLCFFGRISDKLRGNSVSEVVTLGKFGHIPETTSCSHIPSGAKVLERAERSWATLFGSSPG